MLFITVFQVRGEALSLERGFREFNPSYTHSVLRESILRARHCCKCQGSKVSKTGQAPAIDSEHSKIK